jgi:hypothetical protein
MGIKGYRYDYAWRLAQVLDGGGNVLATHAYGASNQRLMSVEGGVTKFFAWAGGQIIAEYEASGANALVWKTSYVYLGGRLLATTSGAGGTADAVPPSRPVGDEAGDEHGWDCGERAVDPAVWEYAAVHVGPRRGESLPTPDARQSVEEEVHELRPERRDRTGLCGEPVL